MKFFQQIRQTFEALAEKNQIAFSPLLKQLRHYSKARAVDDARAGLNVAMMAFPQGMAYALIAGLPIQYGLFGFVGASLLGAFFGSSRFSSYGPSNATAVLMLTAFIGLNVSGEEMLVAVPVLVLLAGVFLILGAFANVAKLIQYISRTVITGYITAAALQIITNQAKNVFGVETPQSASLFSVVWNTLVAIPGTHFPALALSLLTAATYFYLSKYWKKLPGVAITIVLMSVAAVIMSTFDMGVATLSGIELSNWKFAAINPGFEVISQLATPALALAFLITLESSSIGKSLASRSGSTLNNNQEMLGLGVANISSSLFGGMAASASLTRSKLNMESGAWSAMSNVFAAVIVALLLVGVSPLVRFIPVPALAVVVIYIGFSLINRHAIRIVSHSTKSDAITFFVTLIAGVFLSLDSAIYMGSATAILLFLRKVAEPELIEYSFNEEGHLTQLDPGTKRSDPEVSIVHVEGELFFGAAEVFYNQTRRVCEDPNLKILILKLRNAHRLDASAVMALEELLRFMNEKNRYLLICEARKDAIRIFKNSGLLETIGRDNIFPDNVSNPTASTAAALKRAKALLAGQSPKVSIYVDTEKHDTGEPDDAPPPPEKPQPPGGAAPDSQKEAGAN